MSRCRACARELEVRDSPIGPALACGGCDRFWIDPDALDRFRTDAERRYDGADLEALAAAARARKAAAIERPVVYCRCPGCGNQMLRRTFGEASYLLVHFCAAHGYWIDADELAGIADYVRRGGEVLELRDRLARAEEQLRKSQIDVREAERRAEGGAGGFIPSAH